MSGHLRLVDVDEQRIDPVEELAEGIDVLARLSTNPLLEDYAHAQSAIRATQRLVELFGRRSTS